MLCVYPHTHTHTVCRGAQKVDRRHNNSPEKKCQAGGKKKQNLNGPIVCSTRATARATVTVI